MRVEVPIEYRTPETAVSPKVYAYYPEFDRANYSALKNEFGSPEYEAKKNSLHSFTNRQLETLLSERFNVLLSSFSYDLKDGVIYGKDMEEPFSGVLKRGRDYRKVYGKLIDREREEAEVIGFQKIQDKLGAKDTAIGASMLSISLPGGPGSTYQHNFYDIFTLKEEDGKRYVEARRYSSKLNLSEAVLKSTALNSSNSLGQLLSAEKLLANPFEITNESLKNPDDTHKFMHGEHEYKDNFEFEEILANCIEHRKAYLKHMEENPDDEAGQALILNAILNKAEQVNDVQERRKQGKLYYLPKIYHEEDLYSEINHLGRQQVRERPAGCGSSGGFGSSAEASSPFSVSEFGRENTDKYGSLEFNCPKCNRKNLRPKNQLLAKCQHCGSSAVGCESGGGEEDYQEAV